MADNNRALNRVFTRGVLGDLLQNGSNEVFDYVVSRYVNDPENKTHGELFSEIYAHLGKEKRNEYYEYEDALMSYYNCIPQVAPVFHFRACLDQFQHIPINIAQGLAFKQLKKRNKITKKSLENVQNELKSIVYFAGMSNRLSDIEQLLKTRYRG